MLDRRSFLVAAAGAASLPMPALARATPTLTVLASRALKTAAADDYGAVVYPSIVRTPSGALAVAWNGHISQKNVAVLQLFSSALAPRSEPVVIGESSAHLAIGMSAAGGVVVMSAPNARSRAVTADGGLAGPYVKLTSRAGPGLHQPAICPRPDGTFLAAWASDTSDPDTRGLRAVVLGADGRRRTGLFNLFPPFHDIPAGMAPNALVPVGTGTVAVACTYDGQSISVRSRRVFADGSLGPVSVLADGLSWSLAAPSGFNNRIAVIWRRNGLIEGGLYTPDGRRTVQFETLAGVADPKFEIASPALASLGNGRLFSMVGPAVYDLATGKVLARPSLPEGLATGFQLVVAAAGRDRVAFVQNQSSGAGTSLVVLGYA